MAIKSFRDVAEYEQLLCDRRVDQIIHYDTYDRARHTNEREMIDSLAAAPGGRVALHELARGDGYAVYAVDRAGCGRATGAQSAA
jgi:hypothetical protein